MAFPILQISVDAVTVAAIIGLILRERVKNKKEKNQPADGKGWTNGLLEEIRDSVKALQTSAATLDKNYAVIARGMEAWHDKCEAHLETQATINLEVKGNIKSLDERIFKIIRKDRGG